MRSRYFWVLMALIMGASALAGPGMAQPASPVTGPPAVTGQATQDYRIGPLDRLNITVYQVKDLTLQDVQVDASGRVLLPLIGSVMAADRTAPELSAEIANRLRGEFLQDPQVSVWVSESLSQKVTVDGSVIQPGVYPLIGPTTLIQAVSMAKGPDNKTANLTRVIVFRVVDGKRTAAVFNLKKIRQGVEDDPVILGNDVIVVDGSQLKGAWRELLGALPGAAIFRQF